MSQTHLNNFFKKTWKSNFNDYTLSGHALASKIPHENHVLDVGCGTNPFKNKIINLVGIDPVFLQADYKTTIEEFKTDQLFDSIFALDSIIFGSEENIINQLRLITNLAKPTSRIYFRSPDELNIKQYAKAGIEIYDWDLSRYTTLAKLFNFRMFGMYADTGNSVHAIWDRE